MQIRTKLVFLLSLLIFIFLITFIFFRNIERKTLVLLFQKESSEKKAIFDKLLILKGKSLETLVYDYTYWDEMVNFIATEDKVWAKQMIDTAVLSNFDVNAIWIYKLDSSLIHFITNLQDSKLHELSLPKEAFNKLFQERFCHFFLNTPEGLMEIRAATVHPTADVKRKGQPQGYFFAGRLWSNDYIAGLSELTGSPIVVSPVLGKGASIDSFNPQDGVITFTRLFTSWDGSALMQLKAQVVSETIKDFNLRSKKYLVLLLIFAGTTIGTFAIFTIIWIGIPLHLVSRTLETENLSSINKLQKEKTEFGDISRLIDKFFKQRRDLLEEIAERKKMEKALKSSKEGFHNIVERSADGIIVVDQKGIMRFVNSTAASFFGRKSGELLGELFGFSIVAGKIIEVEIFRCGGEKGDGEIRVAETEWEGEIAFLVLIRDITEHKKAEKEREALIKQLEERQELLGRQKQEIEDSRRAIMNVAEDLDKSKRDLEEQKESLEKINKELDDFTYIVSHDLKEPLRSIDAFSKFIEDDYKERLDQEGRDYLVRIRANAFRMQALIEDLLELSRIERMKYPFEEVQIEELVNEAKLRLGYAIEQKNVQIIVGDKLPKVFCDRVRLTEVFVNLISNAIKFNDKPEPIIEIGSNQKKGFYEFYVKDNGPGIEEQYFDKIFEIFQRLSRREGNEGTGAGLTIVKKIVQMHKGKIWLESKIGEGTRFYFTIPKEKEAVLGKKKIGEILIDKKKLTEIELKEALEEQEKSG